MMNLTFESMESWDMARLRKERESLRNELASEIHKRDAIKAEILWLAIEIEKYKE